MTDWLEQKFPGREEGCVCCGVEHLPPKNLIQKIISGECIVDAEPVVI
jgi:hypothetical protein